jgi:hypothetical protein
MILSLNILANGRLQSVLPSLVANPRIVAANGSSSSPHRMNCEG